MNAWTFSYYRTGDEVGMAMRPDMAEAFASEGGKVPPGPSWTLRHGRRVVGIGGLERKGAATSLGWLLAADGLTPRDWVMGRLAIREALIWASRRGIKHIQALATGDHEGACRLLAGLGFRLEGADGADILMTKDID